MKTLRIVLTALCFAAALLLIAGCLNSFSDEASSDPHGGIPEGYGALLISLAGENVLPSLAAARTMLPLAPQLTRYELVFTDSSGQPLGLDDTGYLEPYVLYNSAAQLDLPAASYYIVAYGYEGEKPAAKSDVTPVTLTADGYTPVTFELKPYMEADFGVLSYSLNWDGLARMPARAELLIETYEANAGTPIPPLLIPDSLNAGSSPGTILLLDGGIALVSLTGSLELPAAEYRLTISVTMDEGGEPVSRMDFAHVYSNLTTPAAFYYIGEDTLISNTGVDTGPGFITSFNFSQTPNATSVIGSVPGTDGTRLIMVIVPNDTELDKLTPVVTLSEGAKLLSPVHPDYENPLGFTQGEIDFTKPTVWTVAGRTGTIQRYTVQVSKAPSDKCQIVDFFFKEVPGAVVNIDETAGTIGVVVPNGTALTSLSPVVSIIGEAVVLKSTDASLTNNMNFSTSVTLQVKAHGGTPTKDYTVTVTQAPDNNAAITAFAIKGYPGIAAIPNTGIETNPGGDGYYHIGLELPYGVSLKNLTPLIQYEGVAIDPGLNAEKNFDAQNFNVPVYYTVTAADNTTTKKYKVVLSNQPGNTDTGIFDFIITNVPKSKVVIGQKPRGDGKIPIVIQVPYINTNTGAQTDLRNLIPAITLNSPSASIAPASGIVIPFGNNGNYQEAIYRVTSESGATQDYVAVVSQDVQYYYVNGTTGSDSWPEIYNGGSESYPFKTLAYAVYKAQLDDISKIFVSGTLDNASENGAYENTSGGNSVFEETGGDSGSVFDLRGTNGKAITVTGVGGNATLMGTTGKRVLSVTGGADLTFENITITGGNTNSGNGGGIYISGGSKVKFTGGSITGNTAVSGGGVYVNDDDPNGVYDFTLINSSISNNTATGTERGLGASPIAGGGGVYINNYALFWLSSGTITGNKAKAGERVGGSGGGVLINGFTEEKPDKSRGEEYGLLMSGGSISNNDSQGALSPHGGGGVYVAKGVFEMLGGTVSGNNSVRQGGGVFVASDSRFTASGDSSIINNEGVGSSKAICNRGYTVMTGKAQADSVYVWIDDDKPGSFTPKNSFWIAESARIKGIVLAYSGYGKDQNFNLNRIYYAPGSDASGTDQVCQIDFEMHLINNYSTFADTSINDWLGKKVIDYGSNSVPSARFPLNTLVGRTATLYLPNNYKIDDAGKLVKK
jgi:hypothetical protein